MTLAARHLQTRRPRKDRAVTWSRIHWQGVRAGDPEQIVWTFWRRDSRNALHSEIMSAHPNDPTGLTHIRLLDAKRKLRDRVDEIDLALMEEA